MRFGTPAQNPRVLGIGMAATRDLISYLRYETADAKGSSNPALPGIKRAFAFGISQAGRFLRDYVHEGFNQDEAARKVFDGMLAHTAGAGGVFLNYEFGQPNRTSTQHEDHTVPENAFPFSTARMTDPVTGKTGGVLYVCGSALVCDRVQRVAERHGLTRGTGGLGLRTLAEAQAAARELGTGDRAAAA